MWKTHELGNLLLPGVLGCASWGRTSKVKTLLVLLNECKARVLEEALKRQMQDLYRFQLEGSKFLDLAPEGVDAQSLLLSLPPFAVLRRNIAELQLEPRKSKTVASTKTTILNYLTSMCNGIERTREIALTGIDLTSLLTFIQNNDITPTRGDRSKRKVHARVEVPHVVDVYGFGPDPWT
jgi:hypothetical protein